MGVLIYYFAICLYVLSIANGDLLKSLENMEAAPPYMASFDSLRRSLKHLMNSLPFQELVLSDVRRQYGILMGVLAGLVEYMNSDCTPPDYDHQYLPTVDTLVPVIWQHPITAAEKIANFINDTHESVKVIKELKDYYCKEMSQASCDKVMHIIIDQADMYKKTAKLLLLGGEIMKIYESISQYEADLRNFGAIPLLIRGKDKFKPIVLKAAEIYRIMYGKVCQP